MRIYKYVICLFASMLTLQSCGDFLEEESQSEVIPKSATDFSELLVGSGYPDNSSPSIAFLEYLDDDCEAYIDMKAMDYNTYEEVDAFAGQYNAITPLPYYSWQPYMMDQDGYGERLNSTASSTSYAEFYSKIMGCNAVLDGIDAAVGSQSTRDRVKAEALAVRAMLYFQLVNIYGEPYNYNKEALGVPLKLNANLSTDGIERATVAEVYEDVIVPDLLEAAELMDPLEITSKDYRINQPSIHILLSRAYLFMERYQECIDEADKALGQGIRLMNLTTELDESSLMSGFKPFDYDNPEVQWVFGAPTRNGNTCYMAAHSPAFRAIWDKTNDLRWAQLGLELPSDYSTIYIPTGLSLCQSIRTAEAYLNKAEAEAMLQKTAEANETLNTFCATRINNYTEVSLNGDELVEAIREERRKEFCFQGFRWFDLRRYGMPEIKHIYREDTNGPTLEYTLQHNDPMYTLPLPQSLFEKNVSLIQNSCRSGAERTAVPVE